MEDALRKFRDRLRIIIILYTCCERLEEDTKGYYGIFRSEIKIQALDFLLRYPDFLSMELMSLIDEGAAIDQTEIREIIHQIYQQKEPEIRVEEMEKFFNGAYESIDEVIAFHVSIGFLHHESKKRTDGKNYDKQYYITNDCVKRIEEHLKEIAAVKWYFDRCELLKRYFNHFPGTELKTRQYRYTEYSGVSYKSYIKNINSRVSAAYFQHFKRQLL